MINEIKKIVKERNEAFIDFVLNGNEKKLRTFCKKYQMPVPERSEVLASAVYKAVQECIYIDEEVKALAREKCKAIDMSPYMF